ncbi:glutathione S-transferase N-terminal domain-containing protein [Salinisphaera sp. P385]|uniref:Glutathione S-transferase N-terminal domain-containing protein n=1 Tax=Spectribacter acetivorans TaxID=3075603 RepID=A0ABU3B9V8_9GAMM|nr:glutathione S-transferase N-terminal domain-containing protein [Salinisphaera sp. P385]MDT0618602.1 glutathione S-transferase N-terminal domain-containing protein [Salinisphaera sp. P385]
MATNELTIVSVSDLFREAGVAHHEAFESTNDEDPDWPIWYADYLLRPLSDLFEVAFTRSQLIYCLMNAEFERRATAPDADWSHFYANHFLERYAGTDTPARDDLALYITPFCPFCRIVRQAIDQLGIDVELRDIASNADFHRQLVDARQRATVPVLHIRSPDGQTRWMPESRDIVHYLQKTYG